MRRTTRLAALLLVLPLLLACLAIPAGASFESEYKCYRGEWAGGGLSPIRMKLEEDTLTFHYSPVFYLDREYWDYTLTEEDADEVINTCVAGFRGWEGVYEIRGRELTVVVEVEARRTDKKLQANVMVLYDDYYRASMVPGSVLWRPWSPFLRMYLYTFDPRRTDLERVALHEFGHVLGLFDAYRYGAYMSFLGIDLSGWIGRLLPEAPPDRAPEDSVMRSGRNVTPTEIEMLLWAWKNNRLQLYTKSVLTWLGAQVSPAFSN